MQNIQLIILLSLIILVSPIFIGRLSNARLLPGLKNQTVWLFNQTNINACLCSALQRYPSSQIAGLNSYSLNLTCQLILSPPVLSPKIITDTRSNLILLQPLNDAPCCSDLSWLLDRVQYSATQFRTNVSKPSALSINPANTFLSTMTYNGPFVRIHRNNMSVESKTTLPSPYACFSAVYRKGYIFFGCDTPAAVVIFKETNLTSPVAQISTPDGAREVSFARNDTLLFVTAQFYTYSLYIYNITWASTISTSLVTKLTSTSDRAWTLYTVNDSFVLMTSWDTNVPVYAIKAPSNTSNAWSMVSLITTKVGASNTLGEAVTDSCGRIWVVVYGVGIRIYDRSGTTLLGTWSLADELGNMILLATYELFVTNYDQNLIYNFRPNVQCTS